MKIDFDMVMDYIRCPMYYLLKYTHYVPEVSDRILFNDSIKTTVLHIFYRLMDKQDVDEDYVKTKWEQIWLSNITKSDILDGSADQKKIAQGYAGWKIIRDYYLSLKDNPGTPLAVDFKYEVPIGSHVITGAIDLVRELRVPPYNTKNVEIDYFSLSEYTPDEWELRTNFQLTMASYAFRREFSTKEQRIIYYNLKNNKQFLTTRTEEQFKRLENFINIVCTSIQSNFYFPKPSFQCRQCPYRSYCEHWGVRD